LIGINIIFRVSSISELAKRLLAPLTPRFVTDWRTKRWARRHDLVFASKSAQEAFSLIYEAKLWGGREGADFYSGPGSHDQEVIGPYLDAISTFLKGFDNKPDVVDLGCGDFNIGRQVRSLCGRYIACDVVPLLIERNKLKFGHLDVDFRCIDIVEDELPPGQIVFLRQVLQHLSNAQIARVVSKLGAYQILVLAEHLPAKQEFVPNRDKPIGDGTRLGRSADSGIVVTAPPFNLSVTSEHVVCETPQDGGVIRTTIYRVASLALQHVRQRA
jgi:hypothetical protein